MQTQLMQIDPRRFGDRPGHGNGEVVDRAEDAPAGRSSDRERFHSGKLARQVEFIHPQIPENGAHGNAQAPIQGSNLSRGEHDRQTRILADAEHQLAMLREQKVRVPIAEERGRSSRVRHDQSAQPPQELLRATESDHVDARLRAVNRQILPR